jgi:phosphatidylserine/phosphatidylglycerophosphate/cardiolipin synthase-like enzyme
MRKRTTARSQLIAIFLIMALVPLACTLSMPASTTPSLSALPTVPEVTVTESATDWLQSYFTDPSALQVVGHERGLDEILSAAIIKARLSVDVAAFGLDLVSIRDALIQAHQRGVVVRVLLENDNNGNQEIRDIQDAGVTVIGDNSLGLMHNDFVIIDRNEVWTGSMDLTLAGTYNDNNNLLHIHNKTVALKFLADFDEMFNANLSGLGVHTAAPGPMPSPMVSIEDTVMEVYFLPDNNDAVEKRVNELIRGAKQSIYYLSPEFYAEDIYGDLSGIGKSVTVSGVVDSAMAKYGVPAPGNDVRAAGNKNGSMHESVMIIDQRTVIIGSYNFTSEVNQAVYGSNSIVNNSNLLIIDNPEIAGIFSREFWNIYQQSLTRWPPPELLPVPTSSEPTATPLP